MGSGGLLKVQQGGTAGNTVVDADGGLAIYSGANVFNRHFPYEWPIHPNEMLS